MGSTPRCDANEQLPDGAARACVVDVEFEIPEIEEVDVMVVDDERVSNTLIVTYFEKVGHPVRSYTDPVQALDAIRVRPPQILVTDLVMPRMSGVELARQARGLDPDLGLVFVTGMGDSEAVATMLEFGAPEYLAKPIDLLALGRVVQRTYLQRAARLHHSAMVDWMHGAMERNAAAIHAVTTGTLASLINALDARSPYFKGHSRAVAIQAAAVAQCLGLSEATVERIRTAGLLHDIGMIGVPDAVVDKPGALDAEELDLVRGHCEAGVDIIEPMTHLGEAIRYIGEHHERIDGSGYPAGKRGDEISLGGQVVGIAEAWTGILESRAYREGRTREEGFEILVRNQGHWFSSIVTEALLESDVGVIR